MQILDQAVDVIRKRGGKGAEVASSLEAIASLCDEAAKVWKGYLDQPGATGDKYTLISWMGPDRANQLYSLHLKAMTLVDAVCAAAGPQARFLVLDESPIVMAYAQLQEGETGPQAAQARLAAQTAMSQHLRTLADKARSIKPGAASKTAAKTTVKKAAKAKPARKKVAKKAAKKKAAKKPVPKKPAKRAPKKK